MNELEQIQEALHELFLKGECIAVMRMSQDTMCKIVSQIPKGNAVFESEAKKDDMEWSLYGVKIEIKNIEGFELVTRAKYELEQRELEEIYRKARGRI